MRMLTITPDQNIYIYTEPVDMRKAINGLIIILQEVFEQNPQSGDLYIFVNRQRNKVKCLYWDTNGFVLFYKRLEKGRFNYSKYLQGEKVVINEKQLQALLMGLDFYKLGTYPAVQYQNFF
jgi:transposase